MDISIIILNYKSKGLTLNCIKSIEDAQFKGLNYEIIVVDNNSHDCIGDILAWQYPKVIFIQNKKNTGMGSGNNVGLKRARGKYAVVVNPDIISFKDTFIKLYDFMEKNIDVGVVGPQQLNPDKSIQESCFRWYSLITPLYRRTPLGNIKFAKKNLNRFTMKDFDHSNIRNVNWLLGSFLFCRLEALKEIGYFDERFFLYFEDTDLCRKFWEKGWRVVYNPEVKVIHNHIQQSANDKWYKSLSNPATRQHISSWIKYLRKWGIG